MIDAFFSLIETIAKRNGALDAYSLQLVMDDDLGASIILCEPLTFTLEFPETTGTWLFKDVSDDEATRLLKTFLRENNRCTFELNRHFARLLATKGSCIKAELLLLLDQFDWESYASPSVLLAALSQLPHGADRILQLLEIVPTDARDGLFTACWYCEDARVQDALQAHFEVWKRDPSWGNGDMEDLWFAMFSHKWKN